MEISFSTSHAIFFTYNNWWDLGKYQNHCVLSLLLLIIFFKKNPGFFNLSNRSLRMKKKERKKQDKAQINIPINHIRVIKNYRMELFFSSAHNIFFFYNGWGLGKN